MDRTLLAIAIAAGFTLSCSIVPPAPPRAAPRLPAPISPAEPAPAPPAPEPEAAPTAPEETRLRVTATAYNSVPSQGVGRGTHGAWGDRLEPGTKAIAVSLDLVALGLTRGAKVQIEGLPGHYIVMDRLPRRWSRRIDIYMGKDVRAARAWGRREVQILWEPTAAADID